MTRRFPGGLLLMLVMVIFIVMSTMSLNFVGNRSIGVLLSQFHTVESFQPGMRISDIKLQLEPSNFSASMVGNQSKLAHLMAFPGWDNFMLMVSIPESFPPEAQGAVDEGLLAWRELIESAENKTGTQIGTPLGGKGSDKQCPYSIDTLNQTAHKRQPLELEIPCGMVLESSITVVGTPRGLSGKFAIQLLGARLPGEADPPIVLEYSVRLRGDRITNHAVIVMNTWTNDVEWGEEERCPPPNADERNLVDGLERCMPQIGKVISMKESGPGKRSHLNPTVEAKPWFPFTEGFSFAATLWVGWEGFHMTVNGRHTSSFEYRQNLEPSLVNGVRIQGDLKTPSVIVNGLPISEDAALVPDLNSLKAPPLPQQVELFIGIFSTSNNFDRRMGVRRSWMQYPIVRNGSVAVRFFVGLHKNQQVNKALQNEALTYGDMQLLPFVDYYNLITFKTLAICIFATKGVEAKYVMKTDDDTFVRVDAVADAIHNTKHNNSLLYGLISFSDQPQRDPSSKWYVTFEEWPHPVFPPWAHGPGYVFSEDIAHFVVKSHEAKDLKFFKLEDVAMGMWIEAFKQQRGKHVNYVNDGQFFHVGCESGYTIAHYQNPARCNVSGDF